MTWPSLLGIALGLAMDALAVSIAAGLVLPEVTRRHTFRLAFHFGLFQALMPVIGWLAGAQVARHLSAYDHWFAFGLLAFVGGKMLWDAREDCRQVDAGDPTRGLLLVTLSVATSIDALAVGMSLGLLGISVWVPAAVIGLVAAALTAIGIHFGSRLGARVGRWAHAFGGVVLVAIGTHILISHLTA